MVRSGHTLKADPAGRDVTVPLYNDSDSAQVIAPHERIGQMIIQPIPDVILCKADRLSETDRGQKGFGSTGRL